MATVPQALEKLRAEVENAAERHSTFETAEVEEDYEVRINKTLHSLQNQVKQHEAALEEVRFLPLHSVIHILSFGHSCEKGQSANSLTSHLEIRRHVSSNFAPLQQLTNL